MLVGASTSWTTRPRPPAEPDWTCVCEVALVYMMCASHEMSEMKDTVANQ